MEHEEGVRLGEGWVAAWNRHDLDAVMARLHDDIVFSSLLIPVVVRGAGTYGEAPGTP